MYPLPGTPDVATPSEYVSVVKYAAVPSPYPYPYPELTTDAPNNTSSA